MLTEGFVYVGATSDDEVRKERVKRNPIRAPRSGSEYRDFGYRYLIMCRM